MSDIALLEQIAGQAAVVRRCQKAYFGNRDPARQTPLLRDSRAAEKELDRLLDRRDGVPEQAALIAEGARA